jgi:preprotein translocase subunit SecB
MKSVCELEDFCINKLMIEGLQEEDSEETSVFFGFDYDLSCRTDNQHIIKIVLKYSIGPNPDDPKPRCPYSIHAEMEGIFRFPEDMEDIQMAYLCRVNSLTILYGILRGEIANVTGSCKNGKFILPTVMMEDIVTGIEERKTKEREAKQATCDQEKK